MTKRIDGNLGGDEMMWCFNYANSRVAPRWADKVERLSRRLDVGFWRFGPSSSYQILGVRGSGWDWGGEREREENKSSSMRFVNQIFWRSSETKEASISSRRVDFLSNALGTCRLHHRAVWQTGSSFHRAWQSKPKITPDGSTDDDDDFTALDCRLYRQARLKRREMLA